MCYPVLFSEAGGGDKGFAEVGINRYSVPYLAESLYSNFNSIAMGVCGGDFQKADYMMDCSFFQFYQRLMVYNEYAKGQKAEYERLSKRGK